MKKLTLILFIAVLIPALVTPAGALRFEFVLASEASFNLPHDLALSPDGRYLYVADNGNHRIAVLDPESLKVIGVFGESDLSEPHDVAFDSEGRLLVADTGNDRVVVYTVNGTQGKRFAEIKGDFRRPEGVAADGQRVYVTGARSDNLVVFENGAQISTFTGLSGPHDVEVDDAGNILIVDSNNDRLLVVGSDLQIMKTLTGGLYNFNGPRYAIYDDNGHLYVADKYAHKVKVIGKKDEMLGSVGSGEAGQKPGQLNKPEGVALRGPDVWISDTYNNRIVRYRIKRLAE